MSHSFQARGELSGDEEDPPPIPMSRSGALESIPDTGVKTIGVQSPPRPPLHSPKGAKTRASVKRATPCDDLEIAPTEKKPRRKTDDPGSVHVHKKLDRILAAIGALVDSNKDLARRFDDLSTTVSSKMAAMETKLTTANERITSLQTARRDGLLGQMASSTPSCPPLSGIPHYVSQPPRTTPNIPPSSSLDDPVREMRRKMGLE
ncbi:phosphoprotein [Orinoco virus]|uniref:Phosphoprotein n=1 Tax=Orinoco virus TaxID=1871345 RepID=A0A1B1FIU6_9MONO|nr:phosphoprotein [Orinoco virus]ANQ45644.1 phosphoprotein [Orinoco virus]